VTIPRFLGLLAVFGGLGILVVALRADQVQRSHHVQRVLLEQSRVRQTIRTNEMEIARLRSPSMIQDRARRFDLSVDPPYGRLSGKVLPPDESWLADQ
jgi:hypothetical protein